MTITEPLITSCIFVTYNQSRWVSEAILSCLNQTRGFDEIVIVDNGSSDGTVETIQAEIAGLPNVHLLCTDRIGPSAAFNFAIEHSEGDVLFLMSGDDVMHSTRVERQMEVLQATGADVVFCRPELIDEDGRRVRRDVRPGPAFFRPISDESMYLQLLSHGNFLCAPSCAIRRQALPTEGAFMDEFLQLQDFELWLRLSQSGASLVVDEVPTLSYRVHLSRTSLSTSGEGSSRLKSELASLYRRHLSDLMAAGPASLHFKSSDEWIAITKLLADNPDPVVRHELGRFWP